MFRRIELLGERISGLCFRSYPVESSEVIDAWADMNCPKKKFMKKNVRFYFTEKGWKLYSQWKSTK